MIAMFVGDENSAEAFGRAAYRGEALSDLTDAEAGVNEHARFVGLDIRAVTIGTAAENRQMNSHSATVSNGNTAATLFRKISARKNILFKTRFSLNVGGISSDELLEQNLIAKVMPRKLVICYQT